MGHDGPQFFHPGLWRPRDHHQGRTRQQRLLQGISGEVPPYEESYLSVPTDAPMREAYRELEEDMRKALKAHRGNRSVLSTMLNTLLLYPDHPYGIGTLYGTEFDPELKRRVKFIIAEPRDLPENPIYSKERRLIE